MPRLDVRPEAELDALEAATWYDGERDGLGTEFLEELRATLTRIEEAPARFPVVFRGFRRAILHRFPFGVFFIVEAESATVLAITHRHEFLISSRRHTINRPVSHRRVVVDFSRNSAKTSADRT